jgi:hypothetical protein
MSTKRRFRLQLPMEPAAGRYVMSAIFLNRVDHVRKFVVVGRAESADSSRELRERGRSVCCRAAARADAAAVVRLASWVRRRSTSRQNNDAAEMTFATVLVETGGPHAGPPVAPTTGSSFREPLLRKLSRPVRLVMPQFLPIDPKRLPDDRRLAARRRDGRFRYDRVRPGFAFVAEVGGAVGARPEPADLPIMLPAEEHPTLFHPPEILSSALHSRHDSARMDQAATLQARNPRAVRSGFTKSSSTAIAWRHASHPAKPSSSPVPGSTGPPNIPQSPPP